MPNYLILTEKPSAAANFVKALGGQTGTFNQFNYKITNLRGHVMTLKDPEEMVADALKPRYKSWLIKHLPWDLADFSWERTYIRQRNFRTGKTESTKQLVDDLKKNPKTAMMPLSSPPTQTRRVKASCWLGKRWMPLNGAVKSCEQTLWMSRLKAFKQR